MNFKIKNKGRNVIYMYNYIKYSISYIDRKILFSSEK